MKFKKNIHWNSLSFKIQLTKVEENNVFSFKTIIEEKIKEYESKNNDKSNLSNIDILDVSIQYDTAHPTRSVAFGGYTLDNLQGSVAYVTVSYAIV